jgi:hypothetical protein
MDIFFTDPTDIPRPPEEVRIRQFRAEPWPDKRRVRIYLEVTPFLKRPNGEIEIHDADGNEVVSLSIIESIVPKMDLTVHLRGPEPAGTYIASAIVYYYEADENLPPTESEASEPALPSLPSKIKVVDRAETTFVI